MADQVPSALSSNNTSIGHIEPVALRINDAARVSGLGRTTIYELIKERKLKSVKVGGRRLVPMAALRELIDNSAT